MRMIFLNLPLYIILKFIIFFSSFGTNKCLIYTTIPKLEKSYLKLNKKTKKRKQQKIKLNNMNILSIENQRCFPLDQEKTKQNNVDYWGNTVTDAFPSLFDDFLIFLSSFFLHYV